MKFNELRIKNFGQFHNKTIQLKDGINVVYGPNEAGKSTIHGFLKGMLFGLEKPRGRASKEDGYTKYQPWDTPSLYDGTLDVTANGKTYRIYRNFYKETKEYKVTDLETGRELPVSSQKGQSFLEGLTEDNYRNTISIEQRKAKTESSLAEEVSNYITNLSTSGDNQVNVVKAIDSLMRKKKQMAAVQTDRQIKDIERQIETDKLEEQHMLHLSQNIIQMEQQKETERKNLDHKDIVKLEQYIAEYPMVKERFLRMIQQQEMHGTDTNPARETIQNIGIERESSEKNKKFKIAIFMIYAIILILMTAISTFLKWKKETNLYMAGIVTLILILIYAIHSMSSKRKRRSFLRMRDEFGEETESRNGTESRYETKNEENNRFEEQYIIRYAKRICEFTTVDQSSMNRLEREINTLKENVRQKKQSLSESYEKICLETEKLKWELERYEQKENQFYENLKLEKELRKQMKAEEEERKAIDIALQQIQMLSMEIHDGFGSKLNSLISEFVSIQTDGKYNQIKIDEKLKVKVLKDDTYIELEKLSIGTMDQIYLALRLAAAELIYGGNNMPLLFDDLFAYYDEDRLKAALFKLGQEKNRQIILFTCHKREEEILKQLGISYHRIPLLN